MAESSSHNAMHVAVPLQMRLAALRRRPHLERRRAVSRAGALADAARVSAVVSPQRSHHFSVIANFAKHNERPTTHSKRASHHSSSSLSPTRRGVSVVPRAAAVAATAANAVAAAVGPSVPEMACFVRVPGRRVRGVLVGGQKSGKIREVRPVHEIADEPSPAVRGVPGLTGHVVVS